MKEKQLSRRSVYRFKRFLRKGYGAFCSLHRVVNIGVVTGCVLTAMHVSTSSAQNAGGEQQQKVMEQELEEVMVTASRVETPLNQSAKLVTVITKDEIQRAPVQSLQDLLVYTANVDILQRNGHGVQADISIRGGTFDQTAVLLNGVNLTNAQTGHYSFDFPINLSDIERIEIIHGPAALIYGSSAFTGGINIITKKNPDTPVFAKIEGGMHNLKGLEIRGTARTGIASHSLSAGHQSSDGYRHNTDYEIYNVLWQTRLNLPESNKIDIQLGYNDKKYGANTFYAYNWPDQYEETQTYMTSVKGEFGTRFKVIPILYWTRHCDQFDLQRTNPDNQINSHRNDTYGGNLIFSYSSVLGTTNLGTELRREEIMSNTLGKNMNEPHRRYTKYDGRTNTSVALEHTAEWQNFQLSAGVLMNHNTLLSDTYKFLPSVNISYRPVNALKIYTSWSKSTRMPTFTDLYYTTETHEGTEGLKPEYSQSWDAGLKYNTSLFSAYLTGFMVWGRNVIDWIEITDPVTGIPKDKSWNHTKVDTRGVEAGVKVRLHEWVPVLGERSSLSVDYTRMYQDADTQGEKSRYALNYLRDKFTMNLNHRVYENIDIDWYFRVQKRMGGYDADVKGEKTIIPYPVFSTLDVRMNYYWKNITLHLTLNNLYNTTYYDLTNTPQTGFWLIGGVSYTFR